MQFLTNIYDFVCGHVENCIIKVLHSKMQYIVFWRDIPTSSRTMLSAKYTWLYGRSSTQKPDSLHQRVNRTYDAHAEKQYWLKLFPRAQQQHRRALN